MLRKIALIVIILQGLTMLAYSQTEVIINLLKSGKLDSAKAYIESMISDPSIANDAVIWYYRGYVYKEIYNKNKELTARTEALRSFNKSMDLDTTKELREENAKNIKSLAITFYNDAKYSLDILNYEMGIENFQRYKDAISNMMKHKGVNTIIDSLENIKHKEIYFNLALASVYTKLYESDKKNKTVFLDSAKTTYDKILTLDSNNVIANYNMGILYYNQAVDLIYQMNYDVDLATLDKVQTDAVALFKKSLPFMQKAYQFDPKRKEVLMGLSGIYYSMNDFEKSIAFKKKAAEVEKER